MSTQNTLNFQTAFVSMELCPAPPLDGAIPPTIETLLILQSQDPTNSSIDLSLGNVHFRTGNVDTAASCYESALKKQPQNAHALCNLGIAKYCLLHSSEAVRKLRQALLIDGTLLLAHLYLGRIALRTKDEALALSSFKAILSIEPSHIEANCELGAIHDKKTNKGVAREFFLTAFAADSSCVRARDYLCNYEFLKGREKFYEKNYFEAFCIWFEAHKLYAPSFSSFYPISQSLRELVEEYNKKEYLRNRIEEYKAVLKDKASCDKETFLNSVYILFCEFLFSLGLIPDCFEYRYNIVDDNIAGDSVIDGNGLDSHDSDSHAGLSITDGLDALSEQSNRWRQSLEELGEYPFAHYKLALIYAYRGQYDQSLDELRICFDRLPSKKHAALRLSEILQFVTMVRDLKLDTHDICIDKTPDIAWNEQGFMTRFEIESWRKAGLAPNDASKWKIAGFSAQQTMLWQQKELDLETAQKWREVGFVDPSEVRRWVKEGFSATDAFVWKSEFDTSTDFASIDDVLPWYRAGFLDPNNATKWATLFTFPHEAIQWQTLGVTVEEAQKWIESGFSDPYVVKKLRGKTQKEPD